MFAAGDGRFYSYFVCCLGRGRYAQPGRGTRSRASLRLFVPFERLLVSFKKALGMRFPAAMLRHFGVRGKYPAALSTLLSLFSRHQISDQFLGAQLCAASRETCV